MGELADEVTKELAPSGLGPEQIATTYFLDALPGPELRPPRACVRRRRPRRPVGLVERFHAQHERSVAFVPHPPRTGPRRPVGRSRDHTERRWRPWSPGPRVLLRSPRNGSFTWVKDSSQFPCMTASCLERELVVHGPALIEEPFTVVVLGPGDIATLDEEMPSMTSRSTHRHHGATGREPYLTTGLLLHRPAGGLCRITVSRADKEESNGHNRKGPRSGGLAVR